MTPDKGHLSRESLPGRYPYNIYMSLGGRTTPQPRFAEANSSSGASVSESCRRNLNAAGPQREGSS
jgi:hypothetical protein